MVRRAGAVARDAVLAALVVSACLVGLFWDAVLGLGPRYKR